MLRKLIIAIVLLQAVASAEEDKATVYIYRLRLYRGSKRRMTLSMDGKRLAYLQNGRFWLAKLAPGKHTLTDKNPADFIDFTAEPGKTYYVRCEFAENNPFSFNTRFSLSDPATGTADLRRLRAGDQKQVQNTELIEK